MKYSYNNL